MPLESLADRLESVPGGLNSLHGGRECLPDWLESLPRLSLASKNQTLRLLIDNNLQSPSKSQPRSN